MKKICLVIPSLSGGGMERVMSELAMYFSTKKNIEVHLIILNKGEKFYKLTNNIKVIEPNFTFNNKIRLFNILKTIIFLRHTVNKISPEALLSFGEMYNSFVILGTINLSTNVFVSDRSKPDKKWGVFHEKLRKILYKKANGIIAQTSYAKSFLQQEIKHANIEVIPNPVKSVVSLETKKQKVLLNVGRLIYSKRIDVLLNVFSELEEIDGWNLWIVGDGPERKTLEKISEKLNLKSKVTFWGNQKNVEKFYSQAEIFTFTSISEGFPNAILEAMSFKLPCIAFDCIAGPSDLIKDSVNGFLIDELNLEEYKNRLELLIQDDELRKNMAEKAKIESLQYDIEKIGKKYLDYILS